MNPGREGQREGGRGPWVPPGRGTWLLLGCSVPSMGQSVSPWKLVLSPPACTLAQSPSPQANFCLLFGGREDADLEIQALAWLSMWVSCCIWMACVSRLGQHELSETLAIMVQHLSPRLGCELWEECWVYLLPIVSQAPGIVSQTPVGV